MLQSSLRRAFAKTATERLPNTFNPRFIQYQKRSPAPTQIQARQTRWMHEGLTHCSVKPQNSSLSPCSPKKYSNDNRYWYPYETLFFFPLYWWHFESDDHSLRVNKDRSIRELWNKGFDKTRMAGKDKDDQNSKNEIATYFSF